MAHSLPLPLPLSLRPLLGSLTRDRRLRRHPIPLHGASGSMPLRRGSSAGIGSDDVKLEINEYERAVEIGGGARTIAGKSQLFMNSYAKALESLRKLEYSLTRRSRTNGPVHFISPLPPRLPMNSVD